MQKSIQVLYISLAILFPDFIVPHNSLAQDSAVATESSDAAAPLTFDELKILAAPIALYPDDLVALCIAASLYPLQIVQAERFLEEKKSAPSLEPSDKWDGSVISLLNYPDVVKKMNDDLDWTEQLGDVAANQQKDLLLAIQQLRDEAVSKDVLKSTDQVQVTRTDDNVTIKSADPQTVYVPTYPPEMLYEPGYVVQGEPIVYQSYPSYYYPTAPYWAGFITGAAFAAVVDWHGWGTWGGDIDIDVDIGDRIDFDFNKIDIDTIDVNKLRKIDFKNVDRSKIDLRNVNIDHDKLIQNLKSKDSNNIAERARNHVGPGKRVNPADVQARAHNLKGKDVRKSIADGLKDRPQSRLPKPGTRQAGAKQIGDHLKKAPAVHEAARSAAQQVTQKHIARKKPGVRPDSRPKKPSAIGQYSSGRVAVNHANRGFHSRGGGHRAGGQASIRRFHR